MFITPVVSDQINAVSLFVSRPNRVFDLPSNANLLTVILSLKSYFLNLKK